MDAVFPFGFPFPTAFYLFLYVATLVLHVIPMNYVLAGSTYLFAQLTVTSSDEGSDPLSSLLRDWLPAMLGVTITIGVAPLLFLQILYKHAYYTANLLLFHRWMAILPALIVAYYLLYLLKAKQVATWSRPARAAVTFGALCCFLFTGWSWTENHLLSLDQAAWLTQYESGSLLYRNREVMIRLCFWVVGAFPALSLILGWQLLGTSRREGNPPESLQEPARRLSHMALGTLATVSLAGVLYFYLGLPAEIRERLLGTLSWPYLAVAVLGLVLQVLAWLMTMLSARLQARWLGVATVGLLLAVSGATVLREVRRLLVIDMDQLTEKHRHAMEVGGLPVFLLFFLLNAGACTATVWIVLRNLDRAAAAGKQAEPDN